MVLAEDETYSTYPPESAPAGCPPVSATDPDPGKNVRRTLQTEPTATTDPQPTETATARQEVPPPGRGCDPAARH